MSEPSWPSVVAEPGDEGHAPARRRPETLTRPRREPTGWTGSAGPAAPPSPAATPGRAWPAWLAPGLSTLVTLLVTLWRIQVPSFWRDEGATQSAVHRSLPQLLALLGHMDAVHGTYYLLMWPEVRLLGRGELALRLPSALAMAAAAGLVALLGRRLVSDRAGLAAGLAFAAVPAVSWFAQDARPFALETAAAVASSYCLVRLLDGGRPQRWAAWYAASVAAVGLANLVGLLLVLAHAVTVAAGRAPARVRWHWLGAVGSALVLLSPLEALAWAQRGQVGWVKTSVLQAVTATERLAGSPALCLAVAVILASGLLTSALQGRWRAQWPARLMALGLPWLLLPPALLTAVSAVHPIYTFRYIVFCIPAAALLIGAGLAAAGRVAGTAGLALIVLLALPGQLGERGPGGHADNIRAMDRILVRNARPGDAAVYPQGPGMRSFAAAYPFGLAQLRDVMLAASPAASRTISGTDAAPAVIRGRLAHVSRVWVAEANRPWRGRPSLLRGLPFHLVRRWHVSDIWLWLYARRP